VDAVVGAQASRLAMALGPLVGASDASMEPVKAAKQEAESTEDAPGEGSVSDLVTDLAPDETVSAGVTEESEPAPKAEAAKPPVSTAPKRYKPGTRPLTRPARDKDESESGR
jgi:hypothetical protein